MASRIELRTALVAVIVSELNDQEENERRKKTSPTKTIYIKTLQLQLHQSKRTESLY